MRFKRFTALISLAFAVAGCSQKSEAPPNATPTASPVAVAATSAAPKPSPPPKPVAQATFYFRSSDGHNADVTIWQWPVSPADHSVSDLLGIGCGANSDTDIAVPVKIQLKNTTRNETLDLTVTWRAIRPPDADLQTVQLLIESHYTAKSALCLYEKDKQADSLQATLAFNQVVEMQAFLIARNYYPAKDGKARTEHLQHALITPTEVTVNGVAIKLDQFAADGALKLNSQDSGLWAMPWNPANKGGGCLINGKDCA